ncbi:hypothetical protein A5630_01155 [Mycolicibacterium mucogenicum]|uniref:Uncharacterized protein n=1 Tax=Mycolicibacterium mucogenicum TaxID=56689 RepID=A0A1A3HC25_MYCMU|nr:hypothetical protein A5630_01155 [Mycolicibacterium mucogenicum]
MSFTAVNEDGTESRVVTLEKLPGATELRAELILALAELNGPRKRWRSIYSLKTGYDTISAFLRWLDDQGHQPQSVANISVAMWDAWTLHNGGASSVHGSIKISMVRAVLLCVPERSDALAQAMSRRVGMPTPVIQQSYTEEEFRRIRRAARKAVHDAYRRITRNFELVARLQAGVDLSLKDKTHAVALLEVMEHGMPQSNDSFKSLGAWSDKARPLTRHAQRPLFLTPHEAWACAVLLAAEAGWNRSVIHRLGLPDDSAGAGDDVDVYTVPLNKPRRGIHQHSTTTVLGNTGLGRALKWITAATDPARTVLARSEHPPERLLLYSNFNERTRGSRFSWGAPTGKNTKCPPWGVPDLHPISLRKLRRTHQVLFDRSPAQNTRETHEDVYLRNDSTAPGHAHETVAAGLADAMARAESFVKMRMVPEERVNDAVRSGQSDTAIAACADYEHHPDTGTPCTESFLACLGCTNAIATPRHLPRLVLTRAGLAQLSSTITTDEWVRRWEHHYLRLCSLLQRHSTKAEQNAAMKSATERDRDLVTRMLDGGYSAP